MSKNWRISELVSAPDGTTDAAILSKLVSSHGEYLERLNNEQKLALRAVLSYYLFYKLKYVSDYSVRESIADAMPEYTEASIRNVILTLEGISSNGAEELIKFLTDQRSEQAGKAEAHHDANWLHSQNLAVVDHIQDRFQRIDLHQAELEALKYQMQADFEAVNRQLKNILSEVSRLRSGRGSDRMKAGGEGGSK